MTERQKSRIEECFFKFKNLYMTICFIWLLAVCASAVFGQSIEQLRIEELRKQQFSTQVVAETTMQKVTDLDRRVGAIEGKNYEDRVPRLEATLELDTHLLVAVAIGISGLILEALARIVKGRSQQQRVRIGES
jgi:hypothetical protein